MEEKITILSLIYQVRSCRKAQETFRKEKNTKNYNDMKNLERETDEILKAARRWVFHRQKTLNTDITPQL